MKPTNRVATMELPTEYGRFMLYVWDGVRGCEPVALTSLVLDPEKDVLVRLQSECLTGDLFHSNLCDCRSQTEESLKAIATHGNGVFIYHRQEGRNAGLFKKVLIYRRMQRGIDTYRASEEVTGKADNRSYEDIRYILEHVFHGNRPPIVLLTNNLEKRSFLLEAGYTVTARRIGVAKTLENTVYVESQQRRFSGMDMSAGE